MRQGEVAPKGAWIGDPLGGVKAPQALILPDPTTRFANSAARLEALSTGHPMKDWLRFMTRLAQAQQVVAMSMGPFAKLGQVAVEQGRERTHATARGRRASSRRDLARSSRHVARQFRQPRHTRSGRRGHGEPARP